MKHITKGMVLFFISITMGIWGMSVLSVKADKADKSQDIIDVLPITNSGQAIVVTVPNNSSQKGTIKVYEKNKNMTWKLLWTYPCVVGQAGVSKNRHEGDMKTPEGIYGFLFEFGNANNPGTKMKYIKTKPGDYWSSLPTQAEYNTWVHYDGNNPNKRFGYGEYENLYTQRLYKYAAALDFNYNSKNKIIGEGSAIFLHIAPRSGNGTAGCIALKESSLLKILKWMDPSKNPKICIGTETYLRGLGKK